MKLPFPTIRSRGRRREPAAALARHHAQAAAGEFRDHDRAGVQVVDLDAPLPPTCHAVLLVDGAVCLHCVPLAELVDAIHIYPDATDRCARCGLAMGRA